MRRAHLRFFAAIAAVAGACGFVATATAANATIPSSFEPSEFSATSELDWWVLGTVHCGQKQCLSIVHTQNGGRSFQALPTPPSSTAQQATVSQLQVANARDGYAFGPQLWTTHDGGRSWRQASIGFTQEVVVAGSWVYASVWDRARQQLLMRSPVDRDRWRVLPVPGRLSGFGLWAQGNVVILQTQTRTLISTDQGAHYKAARGLPTDMNCQFETAVPSPDFWALCFRAAADPGGELLRSSDAGASWARMRYRGVRDGPIQGFAAASGEVAVIAAYQHMYRTTDAGAGWSQVAGLPAAFSATNIGFSDSTHGWAIGGIGRGRRWRMRLYYTSDAGASYHRVGL